MLYGYINFLSKNNGYCFATNKFFAKEFGVCIRTVTRLIEQLRREKYITTYFTENEIGNRVRAIRPLCPTRQTELSKSYGQGCQKSIDIIAEHNIQDNRRNNISIGIGGKYSDWD